MQSQLELVDYIHDIDVLAGFNYPSTPCTSLKSCKIYAKTGNTD